jgi:hypothetical protein
METLLKLVAVPSDKVDMQHIEVTRDTGMKLGVCTRQMFIPYNNLTASELKSILNVLENFGTFYENIKEKQL